MFVFDHVGITTTEKQPDENWVEQSRLWVTNPRHHPEHIEFLRYAPDSQVPEFVRNNPHVAYRVKEIEPLLKDAEVFRPSSSATFSRSSSSVGTAWSSNTCAT